MNFDINQRSDQAAIFYLTCGNSYSRTLSIYRKLWPHRKKSFNSLSISYSANLGFVYEF